MSSKDIYNQIRSLADPYPNARSILNEETVFINRSSMITYNNSAIPGEIVHKFPTGEFIIACKTGALLVEDYRIDSKNHKKFLQVGSILESCDMHKTVKRIMERFRNEFSGKRLNNSLESFWKTRGYLS